MTAPQVKGWCPGAYRPMRSGDGLLVRIKPAFARLTPAQTTAVCDIAEGFGNGIIDMTRRANVQIRGVREEAHQKVLDRIAAAGLLDPTPALEQRRNILLQPFWSQGDLTYRLTEALVEALPRFPDLPAKAGFAIDCGSTPLLADAPADIRFECRADGSLMLRADGQDAGCVVEENDAITAAHDLASWYAAHVTPTMRRLRRITADQSLPARFRQDPRPPASAAQPQPGDINGGTLLAVPFGQITAQTLRQLAAEGAALRLTPWRMLLVEDTQGLRVPGLITDPADPLLRVDACPGAPRCGSAHVDTHALARRLAPRISGRLHVSGCTKGCARDAPSDITIVGQKDGFDIVRNGNAQTPPEQTKVAESDLIAGLT